MYVWSFSSIRGPMCSWEMLNFAYLTSFQKKLHRLALTASNRKDAKFNMIFHDSTQKNFFSKHGNKAEFKCLNDSEVLSFDFPGLKTSAASMTSVASTASYNQKTLWAWCCYYPGNENDLSWSPNVEWLIKTPLFYGFWALFLLEAVEAMDVTFNQIQGS